MDKTVSVDSCASTAVRTADMAPAVGADSGSGIEPARLDRLFRHTVRVGGVNPLLHLMPRFRKERAP